MRPHGSPTDLEARRRRAVALLDKGLGVREVARQIDCSPASVSRWQAEV
jgi:transposase